MQLYVAVVFAVIALSSCIILYLFNKNRYYNSFLVYSISAGAFIISISFPIIITVFIEMYKTLGGTYVLITGVITYTTLIMLFASVISYIDDKKLGYVFKIPLKRIFIPGKRETFKMFSNVRENIKTLNDSNTGILGYPKTTGQEFGENILEKSVDSDKNIDTMGIEAIMNSSAIINYGNNIASVKDNSDEYKNVHFEEVSTQLLSGGFEETLYAYMDDIDEYEVNEDYFEDVLALNEEKVQSVTEGSQVDNSKLNIEDYLDEVFMLKDKGDLEGAILHYMYVLDKKPEDSLVFWIILDICVLYKDLGQAELAREILASYIYEYGEVMEESVRADIERNLL
jgi:tetratricopeptide (TPR) repeat protein